MGSEVEGVACVDGRNPYHTTPALWRREGQRRGECWGRGKVREREKQTNMGKRGEEKGRVLCSELVPGPMTIPFVVLQCVCLQ